MHIKSVHVWHRKRIHWCTFCLKYWENEILKILFFKHFNTLAVDLFSWKTVFLKIVNIFPYKLTYYVKYLVKIQLLLVMLFQCRDVLNLFECVRQCSLKLWKPLSIWREFGELILRVIKNNVPCKIQLTKANIRLYLLVKTFQHFPFSRTAF